MRFSRLYESILIVFIILLFFRLIVTSENLITLSTATTDNDTFLKTNTPVQVNHLEPTFGPMEGDCSNNEQLNETYHFSRVTTNNYYFVKSDPLVPMGVFSPYLTGECGYKNIDALSDPLAIFKIQEGLIYIGGEIIN